MKTNAVIIDQSFKIVWVDNLNCLFNDQSIGSNIVEYFSASRALTKFSRWVLEKKELSFIGELTDQKGETWIVDGQILEQNIILTLSSETIKDSKHLSKTFWEVFSTTFPGGIVFTDELYHITEISQNTLNILKSKNADGISIAKDSLLGKSIRLIFSEQDSFVYEEIMSIIEASQQDRSSKRVSSKINNVPVRMLLSPLFKKNTYLGHCFYIFDISEEVELNKKIEEQSAMLFESAKLSSLGEMVGGIAHEINNPLTVIKAKANRVEKELNKEEFDTEKIKADIIKIDKTVNRISTLINGMRSISRDSHSESDSQFSLQSFVDEVFSLIEDRCHQNKIEPKVSIDDELLEKVLQTKKVQLSQVLINLINNAIDAVSEHGGSYVELLVKREKDEVLFAVIDDGPGVDEGVINKIFEPFFTTKEVGKGTGLGLSLSYKIISNLNSELKYKREGEKSFFYFSISKDIIAKIAN